MWEEIHLVESWGSGRQNVFFWGRPVRSENLPIPWTIDLPFLAAVPVIELTIFSGIGTTCRRLKNEAIPKARSNNVENIRRTCQQRIAKSLNKACRSSLRLRIK